MIHIFKTTENGLTVCDRMEDNAWIHLQDPTKAEVQSVIDHFTLEPEFAYAALDEEEKARIETEDSQTLIIVDIPVVEPQGVSFLYNTIPLGILLTKNNIITVCLEETSIVKDFMEGRVKKFNTAKRTRFFLQILYRNSSKFLQYLRQIEKATTQVENVLYKSMKNRELLQMLKLEKSLVFFSTSLKSNEIVLEKMMKTPSIKRYPDDEDLLEDVIIENKQAIEMCTIYRDILSGTMNAFASLISNNLNVVMKLLTAITIIIAIPTLFASFWGMNVPVPFASMNWGFWGVVGISAAFAGVTVYILWRKNMLK